MLFRSPVSGPETESHILYVEWHDRELVKSDHNLLQCSKDRDNGGANRRFRLDSVMDWGSNTYVVSEESETLSALLEDPPSEGPLE